LNQPRLRLGESLAIGRIHSDVAKGGCAIILDVDVGGGEEMNEDWNRTGVDKLLPIVVYGNNQSEYCKAKR
jgi:hypothetical protein